jgi:hypothetical protein
MSPNIALQKSRLLPLVVTSLSLQGPVAMDFFYFVMDWWKYPKSLLTSLGRIFSISNYRLRLRIFFFLETWGWPLTHNPPALSFPIARNTSMSHHTQLDLSLISDMKGEVTISHVLIKDWNILPCIYLHLFIPSQTMGLRRIKNAEAELSHRGTAYLDQPNSSQHVVIRDNSKKIIALSHWVSGWFRGSNSRLLHMQYLVFL